MNYSGRKYGFWEVLRFHEVRGGKNRYWICRCQCGTERSVPIQSLKNGRSKSCGCGVNKIANTKHGLSGTKIYKTWDSMKERCLNPKHKSFMDYGGRGIQICKFLLESPTSIIQTIGIRPANKTLDRIYNEGHYSCGDCDECLQNGWSLNIRWATWKQQSRNRRSNRFIVVNKDRITTAELAERVGVTTGAIYRRLQRGEDGKILLAPPHERKKIVEQHNTFLPP